MEEQLPASRVPTTFTDDVNVNHRNDEIDLGDHNNRILAAQKFADYRAAPGFDKQPIQVSDPNIPVIIYDRDHRCYQLRYCYRPA